MEGFFIHANVVAIYAIYAVSLNLLLGYAGQLSLAHAAFGAVGAYSAGYLVAAQGWSFEAALPVGLAAAFTVGILTSLPALYLDVRYLILLTLALAIAIVAVIGAIPELGGSYGLTGIPHLEIFGITFGGASEFFVPAAVCALIVLGICWRLAYSPFGRILRGIREDEVVTRGLGKNIVFYKVIVFGVTAAMAGMAGILLLYWNHGAQPSTYDLTQALAIIAMVVIGGTANLIGSIAGATLLIALGPVLEDVVDMAPTDAGQARVAIYGALVALFLIIRPQGLIPEHWTLRTVLAKIPGTSVRSEPPGVSQPAGPAADSVDRVDREPPATVRDRAVSLAKPARDGVETTAESTQGADGTGEGSSGIDGEPVLEAEGLTKRFNGIHAADGLDLRLYRGHVTGLIGPNGAGKTTVFNLLTGLIPLDAGSVRLRGQDITGWTPNRIAEAGVARSYQDVRVYPRMSVLDNVMIAVPEQPGERFSTALGRPRHSRSGEREVRAKAFEHLAFVGMTGRAYEPAGSLGFGEQKLVALARLLATEADVLLLDEPASGVDIDWVETMLGLIDDLRDRGKCICVVEHSLHVVERVASRISFMESGTITAEGSLRELMGRERLQEVYFGSG